MEERLLVEIPLDRYEELLDLETRVNVAADLVYNERNISEEVVFRAIGHSKMIYVAERIKQERERFLTKLKEEENGDSVSG